MPKQDDILASVGELAGDTDDQKLAYLCEFYDSIMAVLDARDIWKYLGTGASDAADYIDFHGLAPKAR